MMSLFAAYQDPDAQKSSDIHAEDEFQSSKERTNDYWRNVNLLATSRNRSPRASRSPVRKSHSESSCNSSSRESSKTRRGRKSRSRSKKRVKGRSRSKERSRRRSRSKPKKRSRSRNRRSKSRSRRRSGSRSKRRHRSRSLSSSSRRKHTKRRSPSIESKRKSYKDAEASVGKIGHKPSREELIAQFSSKKTFLEETGLRPEAAFRIDTNGDRTLTVESSLPQRTSAAYKVKCKNVLGLKASRRAGLKTNLRFFQKPFVRAFLNQQNVLDLSKDNIRPVSHNETEEKIKLPEERTLILGQEQRGNPLGIYDSVTAAYLEGKKVLGEDEKEPMSFKLHFVQEKTKEYNRKLHDEPSNIDLWLEFVEFQDVSFQDADFGSGSRMKRNSSKESSSKAGKNVIMKQQALAEKKLAILKSAIDKNPKNIQLALKRLELSREILDTQTLDRQWKELIFVFPKNFELWQYYLRFASSYFTSFSVSKVTKAYNMCFAKLKDVHNQSFLDPNRPQNLEDQMRTVLTNLCHFFARSGFRERGICLFQAMIELNLFSPNFPGYSSLEDRIEVFKQFWDANAPRFGQEEAKGWSEENKNLEKKNFEIDEDDFEDNIISTMGKLVNKNRLWLELELGRERNHWLPYILKADETIDEVEDPDRLVYFETISPYLFQFSEPNQVLKLLLNFIYFLGIEFREDPFFFTSLGSETISKIIGNSSPESISINVDWSQDIFCQILQETQPNYSNDKNYFTFCRNVFLQSAKALKEPFKSQTISLWLKFEVMAFEKSSDTETTSKIKVKEIKGLLKELIQDNPTNFHLYGELSKAELVLLGYKTAWKTLEASLLAMGKNPSYKLYMDAICVTLMELYTKFDNELLGRVLWLLCLAGSGTPYEKNSSKSKVEILSMLQDVKESLQFELHAKVEGNNILEESDAQEFVNHPVLYTPKFLMKSFFLIWISFFTEGYVSAVETIEFFYDKVSLPPQNHVRCYLLENFCKFKVDILLLAASQDSLLIRKCKEVVASCLSKFMGNQYFLRCIGAMGVQPNIIDPTWRTYLQQLSHVDVQPVAQLNSIKILIKHYVKSHEEGHGMSNTLSSHEESIGNLAYLNRANALLQTFVRREPGRYCPTLWRLLMWVTKALSKDVNTVFYKGLQDCPSAKALYLDAGLYLHAFDQEDDALKRTLDIFMEKEGRIRLPVDELDVLLEDEVVDEEEEEEEEEEEKVAEEEENEKQDASE